MRTNSHHQYIHQHFVPHRRRSSSIDDQYNYPEVDQNHISPSEPKDDPMDADHILLPKDNNATNRIHYNTVLEPTPEHSPSKELKFTSKIEGRSPVQKPKTKHRKIIRADPVGNSNDNIVSNASRVPRQRAATEGDDIRPEIGVSQGRYFVGWNVSPSKDPNSRSYRFESNRSITQILENLKDCFGKFEMELTPEGGTISPGEPIKLKGQGKNHEGQVEVELITSNGNTVASFTRSPNLYQEYFCSVIKELELGSS